MSTVLIIVSTTSKSPSTIKVAESDINKTGQATKDIILPTYILAPSEDEKFYPSKVYKVVYETLSKEFDDSKVDEKWIDDWADFGDDFEDLTKDLADKVKRAVKEKLNVPRYKIIVQVTIGQRKDQGVRITSRCLWDTSTDNYTAVNYQNEHVWVSALVFGLYTD